MTTQVITLIAQILNGEEIQSVILAVPATSSNRRLLAEYAYRYDGDWRCSHRDTSLWLQMPGVVRA